MPGFVACCPDADTYSRSKHALIVVMSDIIKNFEELTASFIDSQQLLHHNAPVIVALSGGADSVALLAVLTALHYDCRAAHCNFHLRGDESMRDMQHARDVCDKLGVDLYVKHFDVPAQQALTGESVEMACRTLRYNWFDQLLDRDCAQAVAVGHHREDRAETFMLNLMRGTGIAGLTSMKPRNANTVRPLLAVSRDNIEQYLQQRGLTYITDSSNASDAHRRNRLRNNIFPLLEQMFPGAVDAMLRTITNLESTESIYRDSVRQSQVKYTSGSQIDLARLAADPHAHTLLFELLHPAAFSSTQVRNILAAAGSSGQKFISADQKTTLEISRGVATLSSAIATPGCECHIVDPRHDISEPLRIAVSRNHISAFDPSISKGACTAFFDAEAVDSQACWQLRRYRRGDRIVPFGSKKSKLVSDLFAMAKYSAEQKRQAWIMTRNDEPVWIPGLRNSALWSVGPHTREYITMQLLTHPS